MDQTLTSMKHIHLSSFGEPSVMILNESPIPVNLSYYYESNYNKMRF